MTKKRKSLSDTFSQTEIQEISPVETPTETKPEKPTQATTVYIPREAHDSLRHLVFAEKKSMNAYLLAGLDLFFESRGMPSMSELKIETS